MNDDEEASQQPSFRDIRISEALLDELIAAERADRYDDITEFG